MTVSFFVLERRPELTDFLDEVVGEHANATVELTPPPALIFKCQDLHDLPDLQVELIRLTRVILELDDG